MIMDNNINSQVLIVAGLLFFLSSCYPDEELNVSVSTPSTELETSLDLYIEDNFTQEYGMAIRYRFVDRYVDPGERVTPPRLSVVRPMLDFIQEFWIDPFLEVNNGEAFFRGHVPSEIVFLGGLIYRPNGAVVLGTADAGAQITFTNVNAIDPADQDWRDLQLRTVYHEFAHIVHQRYKLPAAFETISPTGYTSAGSWFTLTDEEALMRGFVSPYSTSSPNEDFAETVAFFLFDSEFEEEFMIDESNCDTSDCVSRNEGREKIREKLTTISAHYEKVTWVNLEAVRNAVQAKL